MTITGIIEKIEYDSKAGHEKKVVTINAGYGQRAFVEFRGRRMQWLEGLDEGQELSAEILFEGKISKSSGIRYNNLVAAACTITP